MSTQSSRRPAQAIGFIAVAALCTAIKGIWAKLAYAQGMSVSEVLAYRFALATPAFWLTLLFFEKGQAKRLLPQKGDLRAFCLGGLFLIGAICDFSAIHKLGASTSRMLLFTFPAYVMALTSFKQRRWPSARHLLAIGFGWLGCAILLGNGSLPRLSTGVVFGIGAALSYGVYLFLSQPLMQKSSSVRFTTYAKSGASLGMAIYLFSQGVRPAQLWPLRPGFVYVAMMALVSTTLPFFLMAEGVKRAGAERASLLSFMGPPATVAAAWIVLGESLSGLQMVGAFVVLLAMAALKQKPSPASAPQPLAGEDKRCRSGAS